MAVKVTIDTSQLQAVVNRAAKITQSFGAVVLPVVNQALKDAEEEIAGLLTNKVLKVRSGVARASVKAVPAHVENKSITGSVASIPNVPYLHFQFTGGPIVPKRGKYLAIPVGEALTPAGVPRYASPRQVPNLIFIPKTKKGNTILALKDPRGGITPLFVLKTRVEIPPHDYLSAPAAHLEATLKEAIPAAIIAGMRR